MEGNSMQKKKIRNDIREYNYTKTRGFPYFWI